MPLYQKANDRFNQGDCSLVSSSSWGKNNSLFPSSSLTSNATYLSPPKRCLIVKSGASAGPRPPTYLTPSSVGLRGYPRSSQGYV